MKILFQNEEVAGAQLTIIVTKPSANLKENSVFLFSNAWSLDKPSRKEARVIDSAHMVISILLVLQVWSTPSYVLVR